MKVEILIPFIDKYTKQYYKVGDVVDMTKKRITEVNKNFAPNKHIKVINEVKKTTK